MISTGIVWFRRDLRHIDHSALNVALAECSQVIPVFVFDPRQVEKNKFKSSRAIDFMIQCLEELREVIPLVIKYGNPAKVIPELATEVNAKRVYCNRDYTKFSQMRDKQVSNALQPITLVACEDILVNYIDKPYLKFTPFYKYSKQYKVQEPDLSKPNSKKFAIASKIESYGDWQRFASDENSILVGGRKAALERLKKIPSNYGEIRNDLSCGTTMMSAYIKFGCVSIREVYQVFKSQELLIRQLYWRDFYYLLGLRNPHVLGAPLKPHYSGIKWVKSSKALGRWQRGETGFPIVDAGMRQLNQTGYMHNRARLITSNFLVKLLGIDWQDGELYYAQKLRDYDPLINNGNWQWSSGSGADSQPYFRIFNPWTQGRKFDREAKYIKKWIPELNDVPTIAIHTWDMTHQDYSDTKYPKPMIDYKKARNQSLKRYRVS